MKLIDLEPWFVRHGERTLPHVEKLTDAQGIVFLCPCGEHSLILWFADRLVPEHAEPRARWLAKGTGFDDLTLSPSINIPTGCRWHGFVRDGVIVDA